MDYIEILNTIRQARAVAILRGNFRGRWTEIADALLESGMTVIEITFGCLDAVAGITEVVKHAGDRLLVGAGTVMTPDQVDQAVGAGAQFIVAPNVDADVIARALHHDVLSVPGAYTPTEIIHAHQLGGGLIKVFPSMPIGPAYIAALRGPLPNIPLMCTGGITLDNAADFLKAGADAVGLTSALISEDVHQFGGIGRLRERAAQAAKLANP